MDYLAQCISLYEQGYTDDDIRKWFEDEQDRAYLSQTQFLLEGGLTKPEIKNFWKGLNSFNHSDVVPGPDTQGEWRLDDLEHVLGDMSVISLPGWQTRGNSFTNDRVEGISLHTSGDTELMDGFIAAKHMCYMAETKPLGNLYVARDGTWWVLAGGTTNACGKGGPWYKIAPGQADATTISVYIGNNSRGEPLTIAQQLSLVEGLARLWNNYSVKFGWNLETWRIFGHSEWAPSREYDPSGPCIWMKPRDKRELWNIDRLRQDVISKAIDLIGE